MVKQVQVFYQGWGESWLWGRLYETTSISGRPSICFEYSDQAIERGLELSAHKLPLARRLYQDFPSHQYRLPGPVYDALPDGWGMLLMDRLFKQQGLEPARISPLYRLCYIADGAMGALSFKPVLEDGITGLQQVTLSGLAQQVSQVLQGEGGEFLLQLLKLGGSPQGARPKLLLYRNQQSSVFSNLPSDDAEPWLVKFPAQGEHPEVCAIEKLYSHCLTLCGIATPESEFIPLPDGLAAFASKRFDRQGGLRVPMQSLAAFTGADYRTPGSLDYKGFLRASFVCTNDLRQKKVAFERMLFNLVFNNRDDHPKNFSYLMDRHGCWQLAPVYDVTFCEGPGGYHQMDVLGEALQVSRQAVLQLGTEEAGLSEPEALELLQKYCEVAEQLEAIAQSVAPGQIRLQTLRQIRRRIAVNIEYLTATN